MPAISGCTWRVNTHSAQLKWAYDPIPVRSCALGLIGYTPKKLNMKVSAGQILKAVRFVSGSVNTSDREKSLQREEANKTE